MAFGAQAVVVDLTSRGALLVNASEEFLRPWRCMDFPGGGLESVQVAKKDRGVESRRVNVCPQGNRLGNIPLEDAGGVCVPVKRLKTFESKDCRRADRRTQTPRILG